MVWVQDEHIVVVIDYALASVREFADDMNKGAYCARRIKPSLS